MTLRYIRDAYGVPAFRGARVEFTPGKAGEPSWLGTITAADGAYLRIRRDGQSYSRNFHPSWNLVYLPSEKGENE